MASSIETVVNARDDRTAAGLIGTPISELVRRLDTHETTAAELLDGYRQRIAALDRSGPTLRSVIELSERAGETADERDRERTAGRIRGPLHGVPVLVKDNIATVDGMETTAGSLALVGARPPRAAHVVGRLEAAGAVVMGKTNLSEWANFRSRSSSSGWSGRGGQTLNPYALDSSPSGSSSGSGAAIAASLAAVALGTETNGSILCPAAACGLVGIKPTVGLTSRSGVIPISWTQDTVGPMARTVSEAALVLSVIAGSDPSDTMTVGADLHRTDYTAGLNPDALRGARIGVPRSVYWGYSPAADRIADDALRAVPGSLREGAFGLGAAKWQVVLRVVFPAALSGIVAALVLGASRAIGETVLILVAGGNNPNLTVDLGVAHQNMAAFIANTARADISAGSVAFGTIFAVGTTLFVITLVLNLIAIRFVRKYRQVYE